MKVIMMCTVFLFSLSTWAAPVLFEVDMEVIVFSSYWQTDTVSCRVKHSQARQDG